jgi:hypothetical protein
VLSSEGSLTASLMSMMVITFKQHTMLIERLLTVNFFRIMNANWGIAATILTIMYSTILYQSFFRPAFSFTVDNLEDLKKSTGNVYILENIGGESGLGPIIGDRNKLVSLPVLFKMFTEEVLNGPHMALIADKVQGNIFLLNPKSKK